MKKLMSLICALLLAGAQLPVKAAAEDTPHVDSAAAILMDAETGAVLYEKQSAEKRYPASVTKIATAIYAIEKGNLDDMVTVSENARAVEGTRVYLEVGEQVPLKKLIQGMLINSGNDAAVAIAEHLDGSVEQFSININEYVRKLGAENTNFINPNGLFDPNHYTTAKDLAKITQYAMKNEVFREIFGTVQMKWDGAAWHTTLFTHHKLMREKPYEGVTGGKTGYIDQSGHTLVTTAERNGTSLIAVTLGGASRTAAYKDTTALLDYGFSHFKTALIPKGSTFKMKKGSYRTSEDYYFSQPIGQDVTINLKEDGTLEVTDGNEGLVAEVKIEDFVMPVTASAKPKSKPVKNSGDHSGYFWAFAVTLVPVLAVFIIRAILKKRYMERRRQRVKRVS